METNMNKLDPAVKEQHGIIEEVMPKKPYSEYGKTSVMILSYNTLTFTKLCLLSLKAHSKNEPPHEIIVVDQGSTDGSHEWLSQIKWKNFKYVRLNYNLLFSKGNNLMRNLADEDSKYLLLLNNDVSINKDGWLVERIKPFEVEPKCGVTGTLGNCHTFNARGGRAFFEDLVRSGFMCTEEQFKERCLIKGGKFKEYLREITGWSMGVRKDLWDKLGGLKPEGKATVDGTPNGSYRHMWSDTEFCCRAQLLGYAVVPQEYNEITTHYSGLAHAAKNDPENYKLREAKIIELMKKYEAEVSLED